jgi:hypothetical protein
MKGTGERWAEESGHDDGRDDDERRAQSTPHAHGTHASDVTMTRRVTDDASARRGDQSAERQACSVESDWRPDKGQIK